MVSFFKTLKTTKGSVELFKQDLLMTKAENSHIHTQIQHDFCISWINSPRRKMLSQKGLGGREEVKKERLNSGKGSLINVRKMS